MIYISSRNNKGMDILQQSCIPDCKRSPFPIKLQQHAKSDYYENVLKYQTIDAVLMPFEIFFDKIIKEAQ